MPPVYCTPSPRRARRKAGKQEDRTRRLQSGTRREGHTEVLFGRAPQTCRVAFARDGLRPPHPAPRQTGKPAPMIVQRLCNRKRPGSSGPGRAFLYATRGTARKTEGISPLRAQCPRPTPRCVNPGTRSIAQDNTAHPMRCTGRPRRSRHLSRTPTMPRGRRSHRVCSSCRRR